MQNRNSDKKTSELVYAALMTCLILLGTMLLRIPIPMTQGYVHLGDAMIYLAVLLLGRKQGATAAALGSALGDILGGFAFWAPWTFIIKFGMAYVTGYLIEKTDLTKDHLRSGLTIKTALAMTAGGLIMCSGYLAAEWIMYGSLAAAAISIPWNIGQFLTGIAVAFAAYRLVKRKM